MGLIERARASLSSYDECSTACAGKLQRIFNQLALPQSEQDAVIDQCIDEAQTVWYRAVSGAESKQANMLQMAQDAIKEIAIIKQALGEAQDHHKAANMTIPTTKAQLDHALESLQVWRERRDQRALEVEALQACNTSISLQIFGPATQSKCVPDLSASNIEFLRMEQERLKGERDKRWRRMEEEAAKLRALCDELGYEISQALGEVHPSLRCIGSNNASAVDAAMSVADLSDASFGRMTSKQHSMTAVKTEREQQLRQLQDVLVSLWEAVGLQENMPERDEFDKLMAAPSCLHADNLEQIHSEVRRLEECRASAMRELVVSKARELQAVCAATHVPAPDIQALLLDLNRRTSEAAEGGEGPGRISDSLAKVVRALSDANAVAMHRKPVVHLIGELQHALDEAAWLSTYETDVDRFKGRDCNAKLQRSIKATKLRSAIPSLIARCRDRLDAWQLAEGEPFLYDGAPYLESLEAVQAEHESTQCQTPLIARTPSKKTHPGTSRPVSSGLRSSMTLPRTTNLTAALTPQAASSSLKAPLVPTSAVKSNVSTEPSRTSSSKYGTRGGFGHPKLHTPRTGGKVVRDVDQGGVSPLSVGSEAGEVTPGSAKRSTGTSGMTPIDLDMSDTSRRFTADDQTTPRMVPQTTPRVSRIPRFTVL